MVEERNANEKPKEHTLKENIEPSRPGDLYVAAYTKHHVDKDLLGALGLYRSLIANRPDAQEVKYARSQILNIVNSAVPKQTLFDAQVALALTYLEPGTKE
jgi:hypothetical protein